MKSRLMILGALVAVLGGLGVMQLPGDEPPLAEREKALKTYQAGNYKESYEMYRALALDPKQNKVQAGSDLNMAFYSLINLGRNDEVDELLETAAKTHEKNWQMLQATAQLYLQAEHYGYVVASFIGEIDEGAASLCSRLLGIGCAPCN